MLEKEISSPKTKQHRESRTAVVAGTGGRRGLNARGEGSHLYHPPVLAAVKPFIHSTKTGVALASAFPCFDKCSFLHGGS